jgi:hypothetical protein
MDAKNWTGPTSVARWYCVAIGLFLGIRAITTLTSGASFAVPGDGWRAVFQLIAVVILAAGIAVPRASRIAAAAVSVIYLLATVSELADGTTLLGAIPVDMRDRFIHPLIALLWAVALVIGRRQAAAIRASSAAAPPA